MATITIKALNINRTPKGSGPITSAYDVSFDDPLSVCAVFSFKVPCNDSKSSLLTVQKTAIRIYEDDSPVFLGVITARRKVIPSNGAAYFEVSGYSYAILLADDRLFLKLRTGTYPNYTGVNDGPDRILDAASLTGTAGGVWSLDTTNGSGTTSTNVYGRLVGESRLKGLVLIAEQIGEHWIYRPQLSGSDTKIIWIGNATTPSGIRAIGGGGEARKLADNAHVCLITSFEEIEDGADLVNRLIPYGAGDDLENGALRITATTLDGVQGSTGQPDWMTVYASSNVIDNLYSITTLGFRRREEAYQFANIAPISNTNADVEAAADMLTRAGMTRLKRYGIPHKFYRLSVAKLPSSVRPGQTLRVRYYERRGSTVIHNIDETLVILNIETRYGNDGSVSYGLTVATTDRWAESERAEIEGRLEQGRIYQSHTQLGPAVYTPCYAFDFDDSTPAIMPFWLGEEVAFVQQAVLRFTVQPLHSTITTVASATTTTGPVDGSTTTGASSTTTTGASSTTTTGSSSEAGTTGSNLAAGDPHSHNFTTPLHSHGMEHDHGMDHAHDFPHVHEFTASITATYGIYQESDTDKIIDDPTDDSLFSLFLNGNQVDVAEIDSAGVAGYYEIDLTQAVLLVGGGTYDLINDNFRPVQKINTLQCFAGTGRTGRIVAQLLIRASVQAVANL